MISVIVPVYNVAEYLPRCIEGILEQTLKDYELILIDDGSDDNSGSICDDYEKKYPNQITAVHQPNKGQAAARNLGVTLAKGEWIHFVDADDLIHPNMLEYLYRAAIQSNAPISMCGAVESETVPDDFFTKFEFEHSTYQVDENLLKWLCKDVPYMYWVVWGKLIKKELLMQFPQFSGRIYEDNAIVCKWLHSAHSVAILNYPMYFYYKNAAGTTKQMFQQRHLDELWAVRERIEFYSRLNYKAMQKLECENFVRTCNRLFWNCNKAKNKKLMKHFRNEVRISFFRNMFAFIKSGSNNVKVLFTFSHPQLSHMTHCLLNVIRRK